MLALNFISGFFPDEAIPAIAGWSDDQELLHSMFLDAISDLAADASEFTRSALKALVLRGDSRGLAYKVNGNIPADTSKAFLLTYFLGVHFRYMAAIHPDLAPNLPIAIETVERWSQLFNKLQTESRWSFLFELPDPLRNRLLHYQMKICAVPAYQLVAPKLHLGLCAKIGQLAGQPITAFDERLGGFANWTIQIVNAIPAQSVRDSFNDYLPGEFTNIVFNTIQKLKTKNGLEYSLASKATLLDDWFAIFGGTARDKEFFTQIRFPKRLQTQIDILADPESQRETSALRRLYLDECASQDRLEAAELHESDRQKVAGKSTRKQAISFDGSHATLAANPSPSMQGALPRVVLAMIYQALEINDQVSLELTSAAAPKMVMFMLHLGRRIEWLLNIQIGDAPKTPQDCEHPICSPQGNRIYYVPKIYLGLPLLLYPTNQADPGRFDENWRAHDLVYEPIDLIHEIILPPALAEGLSHYIDLRRSAIKHSPLEASGLGCTENGGPLWLALENRSLSILDKNAVGKIFEQITNSIREFIPDYPTLRPANFVRSFEAYYASLGLRGEYRFYLSERARYVLEMPLRYSQITSAQVYKAHCAAYEKFDHLITNERMAVLGYSPVNQSKSQPLHEPGLLNYKRFGSWHVVRSDITSTMIATLLRAMDQPNGWYSQLTEEQSKYNILVMLLSLLLALLLGLRPFEIIRIRPRHLDLENHWLAVHGKPHVSRPAFRRLPIPILIRELLSHILKKREISPSGTLLGLYNSKGVWKALTQKNLFAAIQTICIHAELSIAPDLYSFRHRFRTDMLAAGIPEHLLNYLMGHETRGAESVNIFMERSLTDLEPTYTAAVQKLIAKYGIGLIV